MLLLLLLDRDFHGIKSSRPSSSWSSIVPKEEEEAVVMVLLLRVDKFLREKTTRDLSSLLRERYRLTRRDKEAR